MERTCKKCGETKPIEEFDKIHGKYYNKCLICKKQYDKEYHLNHKLIPEYRKKRLLISKEWNDKNKERRKQIDKKSKSRPEYKRRAAELTRIRYYEGKDVVSRERYAKSEKGLISSRKAKRKWAKLNPDKRKEKDRRQIKNLNDCYVLNKLRRQTETETQLLRQYPELVEVKREQLRLYRLTKKQQNENSNRP